MNQVGRADLEVGLDARQRVPTGFMALMRVQSWRSRLPMKRNFVAADVRRLKLFGRRRPEPPYVGCYYYMFVYLTQTAR